MYELPRIRSVLPDFVFIPLRSETLASGSGDLRLDGQSAESFREGHRIRKLRVGEVLEIGVL